MNNGVRIGWERRSRASGRSAIIALHKCVNRLQIVRIRPKVPTLQTRG